MNVEKENMEPTHSEEEGEASNGVALPLTIGKKRKLVILDINGVLALMVRHSIPGGVSFPGGLTIAKRPFCEDFLQFCFERFDVAIWTSRAKENYLDEVVDYLLGDMKKKLLFVWDRSYCTRTGFMTPENRYIPLACKELKKIWGNECPNQPFVGGYYNESNTLLVDDSPYKAVLNPVHTAIFPHSYNEQTMINDRSLGPGGDLREYLEGLAGAEDVRNYVEGHPFGQKPIDYTHCNWKVYSGIIRALSDRS
ncbi:unnamed protein product [Cuscuta epithymum]|uniref:Mitochondrial import inner membrane translocase subunit TIM50 n=3 Tax=Cuscuta epithymum TaxID=186058 RepID=A0AAV0DM34_9ASTE|nr:unnamed protein product [Cuscuta epithymum]